MVAEINALWLSRSPARPRGVVAYVLDNGGDPHTQEELNKYKDVSGTQLWARVGQPVRGVVAVSAADRISVSIINYLHQGTYRPGVIFRSGIMGPALRRIGEQMIEYTYMPMLALGALGVQSVTSHPGPGSSEAHPAGRMIGIGLRAESPSPGGCAVAGP